MKSATSQMPPSRRQSVNISGWAHIMTEQLHTELWTSWASLLRSYAAAHGLNAPQISAKLDA